MTVGVDTHAAEQTRRAVAAAFSVSGRAEHGEAARPTSFENALGPLLAAIGWSGEPRHIIEALPHFDQIETLAGLRVVLSRLGFDTEVSRRRLSELSAAEYPVVYVERGEAAVAFAPPTNGLAPVDAGDGEGPRHRAAPTGRVRVLRAFEPDLDRAALEPHQSWFWSTFWRFRGSVETALALTFLANLLALATPLFSMAIYNNIIVGQETLTLVAGLGLVLGAIGLESYLRGLRSEVVATVAARINAVIQREAFGRILLLPQTMTEQASVGVQIARLRQFDGLLNAFTGPLASSVLDLPFILIFLATIAIVGGPLAVIPAALALIFAVLGALLLPVSRRKTRAAGQARLAAQDLMLQTLSRQETIRGLGAEEIWMGRLRAALKRNAQSRMQAQTFDLLTHQGAQLLTAIAVALVIMLGALLVMDDQLTIGALIAVMMLVWRVLSPIQSTFHALPQIAGARDTIRQIDALMRLPTERALDKAPTIYRRFEGALRAENVSFRYPRAHDLALRGVSLEFAPGETVGLAGRSGSGRASFLKVVLGLQRPSGGALFIDGLNMAQLDPGEVRAAIAYAPRKPFFFFGTVAQNMRLSHRAASDDMIREALGWFGLEEGSRELPDGIETRMTPDVLAALSDSAKQQISLAQAFLKPSPILLLDDPAEVLDHAVRDLVIERIRLRAEAGATLVKTNDARLLETFDRIVVFDRSTVAADGPAAEILPRCGGLVG